MRCGGVEFAFFTHRLCFFGLAIHCLSMMLMRLRNSCFGSRYRWWLSFKDRSSPSDRWKYARGTGHLIMSASSDPVIGSGFVSNFLEERQASLLDAPTILSISKALMPDVLFDFFLCDPYCSLACRDRPILFHNMCVVLRRIFALQLRSRVERKVGPKTTHHRRWPSTMHKASSYLPCWLAMSSSQGYIELGSILPLWL